MVGASLGLRFTLGDSGEEIRAKARVVWRSEGFRGRGGVIGVQFTSVTGADEIAAYIDDG